MIDENELEGQSRRAFLKTSATVGAVATGAGAFGGQAIAQNNPVNVDASQLEITTNQEGKQVAEGLINVQAQNVVVAIQDVLDVQIGDVSVNIEDVEVLSDNEVNVAVADVIDIEGNQVQVAVTILGETEQGQEQEFTGTDTVTIDQQT